MPRHESSDGGRPPWVLVAAGVHHQGGMDKANAALARHLADRGVPVHLVAHTVDEALRAHPSVTVHPVGRPFRSDALGEPLLERRGRSVARSVTRRWPGARVVVNGGNCYWPDVNWVHCVHHAWPAADAGAPAWFRVKNALVRRANRRRERRAVRAAHLVLVNSERTHRDVLALLHADPARVRTLYLGCDRAVAPAGPAEREAARRWLGYAGDAPLVAFVGALGHDRNKGFDTLLAAWQRLSASPRWDVHLVVAGGGERPWAARVARAGLGSRVRLLGFTRRIPEVLAACDLLVSPARYDAYGLNVQEALCRGVPVLASSRAGIAERFPASLSDMIVADPESVDEVTARLLAWRAAPGTWTRRIADFSTALRAYTWDDMAAHFVSMVTGEQAERAGR